MKKIISVLLIAALVVAFIVPVSATDINDNSVYISQTGNRCTLASAAMAMRRRAILDGNNNWNTITLSSAEKQMWQGGLNLTATYTDASKGLNMTMKAYSVSGNISEKLKTYLSAHPEGIVYYVYRGNGGWQHAVLLTSVDSSGTFYCMDPGRYSPGIIPLASSVLNNSSHADGTTQDNIINTKWNHQVWIMTADNNTRGKVAPTITSIEAGNNGTATITWGSVYGAKGYDVYRSDNNENDYKLIKYNNPSTSYTDNNLKVGTRYYYKVVSLYEGRASDFSEPKSIYIKCAAPTITSIEAGNNGTATLTWGSVYGAKGYDVYRSDNNENDYKLIKYNNSSTSYTDSNLSVGTRYYYKVVSLYEGGASGYSEPKNIYIKCDAPTITSIESGNNGSATIIWGSVYGAKGYDVYRSENDENDYELIKYNNSLTSYTDSNLTVGTRYYYKVVSLYEGGASDFSKSENVYITDGGNSEHESVEVISISLDKSAVTVQKGKSTVLTATVKPKNATSKKVTWSSSDTSVATVDSSGTVRGVKAGTATITAKAGGKSASCKVTVKNGSVSVSSVSLNKSTVSLQKGESTALTATVSPSNATDKTVTWKSSNTKVATVSSVGKVTAKATGTATITATAGNKSASCKVTVKNSSSNTHGVSCPSASYADVNKDSGHWTHLPIDYVLQKGYMQGVSEGEFAPNGTVTRAQIVQMLYAKEGKPAVSGARKFRDVAGGKWYANAVEWASTKGVVAGYSDGTFKPEQAVTREQLVTIMYAYARYQGKDLTPSGRLSGFSDAESVSNYAKTPMQWAIGKKIISGMGSGLEPQGRSTRAQIAVILKAYDQNV